MDTTTVLLNMDIYDGHSEQGRRLNVSLERTRSLINACALLLLLTYVILLLRLGEGEGG
jgi:hypothetical protein